MTIPHVTVLMPVYNGRKYLAQALESILSQSFRDFEFLIIDDGSTEPFAHVVESYKDDRIVVYNQEHIGLTRSLNRGLILASGEYVARMDADDVSMPNRLEVQLSELESDENLDLVGSFFNVVDGHGNLIEAKELITDSVYGLWRLQFHNNFGHGTVMFRKRAVMEVGMYDESLLYAQDFDLWSRLSRKENTKILPAALYCYRMIEHSRQASVKNYESQLANAIRISNRSLMASNPSLDTGRCEDLRALYWKFQRQRISIVGLKALPETVRGFCQRFDIEGEEKSKLIKQVAEDARAEIENYVDLSADERMQMIETVNELNNLSEFCRN